MSGSTFLIQCNNHIESLLQCNNHIDELIQCNNHIDELHKTNAPLLTSESIVFNNPCPEIANNMYSIFAVPVIDHFVMIVCNVKAAAVQV